MSDAPEELVEAYNDRDWERLRALLADRCVYEQIGRPKRRVVGPDDVVGVFREWATTAPETSVRIDGRIAGDGGVALALELRGATKPPFGDFAGVREPPSVRAALHLQLDSDGRIREMRNYYDSLVLFQVLGIQE